MLIIRDGAPKGIVHVIPRRIVLPRDLDIPDASEKCEENPSFRKRDCAHCMGTMRGTSQNPHFSIMESIHRGYPVVEVLKNGGPVHRHDEHFRFGCRVARILLASLPALKTFAWPSSESDRTGFKPQTFTESNLGVEVEVFVEMNANFVVYGELIEEYWLNLKELPTGKIHKGVGVMKCKAVCSVQDELRNWLARRCC